MSNPKRKVPASLSQNPSYQNTFASRTTAFSIHSPLTSQIPALRQLWKDTFGDSDAFLDVFHETAFSPERCRCVTISEHVTQNPIKTIIENKIETAIEDGIEHAVETAIEKVIAALYWFDCEFQGQPIAYIYAVATDKNYRGQGLCHALMEDTHAHLKKRGYAGAILSPANESLFDFYGKMGYQTCAYAAELEISILNESVLDDSIYKKELFIYEKNDLTIRKISKQEFAKLRRRFLPNTAVLQEKENLDFLEKQADFYAGENFLLTAQISDTSSSQPPILEKYLHGIEFLGDKAVLPYILQALGCSNGRFRTIGTEKPLGMYLSFKNIDILPNYIGFIFD